MLRQPGSRYVAGRSSTLRKVKTFFDAEGVVLDHVAGAGRHVGRLGSLLAPFPMCPMCPMCPQRKTAPWWRNDRATRGPGDRSAEGARPARAPTPESPGSRRRRRAPVRSRRDGAGPCRSGGDQPRPHGRATGTPWDGSLAPGFGRHRTAAAPRGCRCARDLRSGRRHDRSGWNTARTRRSRRRSARTRRCDSSGIVSASR